MDVMGMECRTKLGRMFGLGALGLVVAGVLSIPADAASTGASKHVKVALVSEGDSIRPGKPFTLGIRMEIDDGWHTYWKLPGDAGLPPRLTWRLPPGFSAGSIQWPVPERMPVPPLMSYGYGTLVLLPVEITPPVSLMTGDQTLAVKVDWLECREVCLPAKSELDLVLPVRAEDPRPTAVAASFAEARRRLPLSSAGWTVAAEAGPRAIALTFRSPDGVAPTAAYFFVDAPKVTEYAAPQGFEPKDGAHRVTLKPAENAGARLDRLSGVLVVEGGGKPRAIEVDVPVTAGDPAPAPLAVNRAPSGTSRPRAASFVYALGLAFLGGLLLNLMPCVLPVLSLKVMSFVRQAGEHPERAWRQGAAFTVGVLLSFWVLLAALLILRAGGAQVGWGFQLQSPPFLAVLSGVFLLLGLNLFGVFELGTSLTGVGNLGVARKEGLAGSFWNGALATVAATPCTAPFMGSALGFALGQPLPVAAAIFTALGVGMASPYMLLSANPRLLRFVPRPGAWMEGFKQFMGFLLLATVAALVWLFGQQTGVDGMGALLAALLVASLGAWIYGRGTAPTQTGRTRALATFSAVALLGIGLAIALARATAPPAPTANPSKAGGDGLVWEDHSAERVAELRAQGTPVFIDFTAAWCLSCQVNERVALTAPDVVARFQREGVVMLRADWTRRDDRIAQAIASYGRQGVPVYVLYGRDPAAPPRLLPEVLTPGLVLTALDETLGSAPAVATIQ
jgi:thiol:disulfide interchange protein DsbD